MLENHTYHQAAQNSFSMIDIFAYHIFMFFFQNSYLIEKNITKNQQAAPN